MYPKYHVVIDDLFDKTKDEVTIYGFNAVLAYLDDEFDFNDSAILGMECDKDEVLHFMVLDIADPDNPVDSLEVHIYSGSNTQPLDNGYL